MKKIIIIAWCLLLLPFAARAAIQYSRPPSSPGAATYSVSVHVVADSWADLAPDCPDGTWTVQFQGYTGTPYTGDNAWEENNGEVIGLDVLDHTFTIDIPTGTDIALIYVESGAEGCPISDVTLEGIDPNADPAAPNIINFTTANSAVVHDKQGTSIGAKIEEARLAVKILFSGRAFPGGRVTIMTQGLPENFPLRQSADLLQDGSFSIDFAGVPPFTGVSSYALLIEDKDGRASQTKVYTPDTSSSVIVTNIFAPPTIGFLQPTVARGELMTILGYGTPGSRIRAELDGVALGGDAYVDGSGAYKIIIDTAKLPYGSHNIRAAQIDSSGNYSDFSVLKSFNISPLTAPKTDLNNDGKIDIQDWSIFLFNWNSKDPGVKSRDDLNGDGKINIADFSIFLKTFKK